MTAPSTYSWWIAYLMKENSTIFFDNCPSCRHINFEDYWPPEWIPLNVVDNEVRINANWKGKIW